jgi:hypothetical protein
MKPEVKKIAKTLGQAAEEYEPTQTANIAELESFDISEPTEERAGTDKDNKPYKYTVLIRDETEYRVPNSMLEAINNAIEANAKHDKKVTTFSVEKTGEGMGTKYQLITLE